MVLFFKFLLAIVLTEAFTEIVTKSAIFNPFRKKIFEFGHNNKFFKYLHDLLDCGYCFSVWSGVFIAFLLLSDINFIGFGVDVFIIGLVLHRLSNLFHNVMDRLH